MGVEAFGKILTKVRSGTLNNVAERLSDTGSDEAMALQYVRDKFDFHEYAHGDISGSGNVDVARNKIFGNSINDTDYINAIRGHQISSDQNLYNQYTDYSSLNDAYDFLNMNMILDEKEMNNALEQVEKLNEMGSKVFDNSNLLNDEDLKYLQNYKPVASGVAEQIRKGNRVVHPELLEEAKKFHFDFLKRHDDSLKNSQDVLTSSIIKDNKKYSSEYYNHLLEQREKIANEELQRINRLAGQPEIIPQAQNTNQINTPSDDFDDELDDFFRSTTNDTPINPNLNQVPPPPTQHFLNPQSVNQLPSFDQNASLIPPPPPITPPPFAAFNPQNPIVPLPPITPSVNQLSNSTPTTNNPLINQSQTPNPLDQVLNSSSPPTNTNTTKPTQQISPPPPVKTDAEILAEKRKTSHEARLKNNPNYAALHNTKDLEAMPDDGSIASDVFRRAMGDKENIMLQNELIGAARNNNPETVNQRIDFYKNQGVIDDKEAEPLKAFFNSSFENMDEEGVEGWFQQYSQNLNENMTPRQARLSVNQKMDNKQEGFFSTNSDDNFRKFAGRSIIGGIAGAAIGTATDDNPEAGFVAGMVGASIGRNAASLLRNNTEMFEGKMINSLLKDSAKGKTRPQQLEAVESLDDEALDFMDKMYKDKLTKNFGTSNMFENSAVTGGRAMTLSGAALAGVAFTPKKRDHRRGFNANRGNRI